MRFSIFLLLFRKELLDTLRDRRAMLVSLGLPLLLYPLMMAGTASLGRSTIQRLQGVRHTVAVTGDRAPNLRRFLTAERAGLELKESRDPRGDLARGRLDAVIELSGGFEAKSLRGEKVRLTVRLDGGRRGARFTEEKIDAALRRFNRWVIERRLAQRGVPAAILKTAETETVDIASGQRRFGSLLAMILPAMLLISGTLGAFYPAVNITAGERELGTLESLLTAPVTRTELLAAKTALVFLFAIVAAGLNMLSMALVFWRLASSAPGMVDMQIDPAALLLSFLASLPTLLWLSVAMLIAGLASRSLREANSYGTLVTLLPLASLIIAVGEPAATPALLATPVVNTALLIRDLLRGSGSAGDFVIAFGSAGVMAAAAMMAAGRMLSSESLINPQWEPLAIRGWRGPVRSRIPGADEALALFGFSILLLLYVGPSFLPYGFFGLLAGSELLLVLLPALLAAWLGSYHWKEVFLLRRPHALHLLGALLLGLGLQPWIDWLVTAQSSFWPPDQEMGRSTLKLMLPALEQHPVLASLAIGILAGTAEEAMFRGPILAGFRRGGSTRAALVISSILFALAHLDLWGAPIRFLLGMLLGWTALRTGSLWPAILLHAVYDAGRVGLTAFALHRYGAERLLQMASDPAAGIHPLPLPLMLAAGALLTAAGLFLLRRPSRVESASPGSTG